LKLDASNDEKVIIEKIKEFFEIGDKNLIVYDNADEIEFDDLKSFFPRKGADIIITTKNLKWDLEKIENKPVKCFNEFEAKKFLLSNSSARQKDNMNDEEKCSDLAEELQYYPLALEQARAYINKRKISFSEYIKLFKKYKFKLMEGKASDYNYTIITAFKISFDKLKEKNDRSFELLALCSFLSNDKIPEYELFLESKVFEKVKLDNIIDNLMSYSLLESANDFIYIHGVIQEIVRYELEETNETEKYVIKIARMIIEIFPKDTQNKESVILVTQLINHIITIYNHLCKLENYSEIKIEITKLIGITLYNFGQFAKSLPYFCDYKEFYDVRRINNIKEYAMNLELLGLIYHRLGKTDRALEVLSDAEKIIKPTNDNCLALIFRSMGIIYKDGKKIELAFEYHSKALDLARNDNDDKLIINQLINIGIIYKEDKKYEDALSIYKEAEDILEDRKEPMLKAKIYGNKGNIYKILGTHEAAIKYFFKALKVFKRLNNEVSIAITLDNIGGTLIGLGVQKSDDKIIQKSKKYFEKSIDICKENHYKFGVATSLLNMGWHYICLNDKEEAIKYLIESKTLAEEIKANKIIDICDSNLQSII